MTLSANRRDAGLALLLLAALALGAVVLPSAAWACGLAALLALAGVVVLRGPRWRSGALVAFALAVALGLLDLLAGVLTPSAVGQGIVRTTEPKDWIVDDPVLGYRPRPGTRVLATATLGDTTVFRATYTITADGTRATPAAPAGADTYLFVGDSFMFGQGLPDGETLPAQFAEAKGLQVRTIDLAAPGYGPNHWVRALETGRVAGPVKAVIAWSIPPHLDRVTGDAEWLGSSPRYVLEGGVLRHTGSFAENRWRHPLDGLAYLARENFAFAQAIGREQRQAEQIELLIALMVRLGELARERLQAPLIVILSWNDDMPGAAQLDRRLSDAGIAVLRVNDYTRNHDVARLLIPHDGHPALLTNQLLARALLERMR